MTQHALNPQLGEGGPHLEGIRLPGLRLRHASPAACPRPMWLGPHIASTLRIARLTLLCMTILRVLVYISSTGAEQAYQGEGRMNSISLEV